MEHGIHHYAPCGIHTKGYYTMNTTYTSNRNERNGKIDNGVTRNIGNTFMSSVTMLFVNALVLTGGIALVYLVLVK
jgi:hypothetical protein